MEMLVTTDWLEGALSDPRLRVFDATVHLASREGGRSGREDYDAVHIPGAGFIDLAVDLSEADAALPYTRPSVDRIERALGRLGVSEQAIVVAYTSTPESTMWATRLWWLLRSAGLEHVAVLDGGLHKWQAEGRPISTDPCEYAATTFGAKPDESWWATKEEVRAAIVDGGVCTLNALPHPLHTGEAEMGYRRPGHITGSLNLPFTQLMDLESGTLREEPVLREHFESVGALGKARVISYCGGGIAATLNGFLLRWLGHRNVAVYDGSIDEWSRDPEMPMETGDGGSGS